MAKGLDEGHPFSDSNRVDVVLRVADHILSPRVESVGRRDASRIWGFMSKFAMLDRFSKSLGVLEGYQGISRPRQLCSSEYLGTGYKVNISL